jgi:dihydrodipicolinate reductase
MTNQTVLVLGAAGYMGRLLTQLAVADGWECIEVDVRLQPDVGRALDDFLPRSHLVVDFFQPGRNAASARAPAEVSGAVRVWAPPGWVRPSRDAFGHCPPCSRVCATNFSLGMNLLWSLV